MKKVIGYIDMTPTWRGLMPFLVEVAARGNSSKGRAEAMSELNRLADGADRVVAVHKEIRALWDSL